MQNLVAHLLSKNWIHSSSVLGVFFTVIFGNSFTVKCKSTQWSFFSSITIPVPCPMSPSPRFWRTLPPERSPGTPPEKYLFTTSVIIVCSVVMLRHTYTRVCICVLFWATCVFLCVRSAGKIAILRFLECGKLITVIGREVIRRWGKRTGARSPVI